MINEELKQTLKNGLIVAFGSFEAWGETLNDDIDAVTQELDSEINIFDGQDEMRELAREALGL